MNENEKSYRQVDNYYKEAKSSSFSKSILVPFISGAVGAVLVLGTCFGVPTIKSAVIGEKAATETSAGTNNQAINTNLISLTNYSDTSVSVAKKVLPSIVGIEITNNVTSLFGGTSTQEASGSGIIISSDGYILTNNHIVSTSNSSNLFYQVSEAGEIKVYLYNDETPYTATIVGQDELTDIAVLKIDKTDLVAAEIGDSDSVAVGEFAMAVGNPLGMQSSITCGNISGTNRELTDTDGRTRKLIQTDAAINSGNSGGALVNSKGQVIGINTLKLAATGVEGMGFAIPINSAKNIYNQLIEYNKVIRPYIGVTGVDVDEKTSKFYKIPEGVYIKELSNFSPAEKAGLKVGDVIVAINGTEVKTMNEINDIKLKCNIGDEIKLKIIRDGNEMEVTVKLEEQP